MGFCGGGMLSHLAGSDLGDGFDPLSEADAAGRVVFSFHGSVR